MKKTTFILLVVISVVAAFLVGFNYKSPWDGEIQITRLTKVVDGPWQVYYKLPDGNEYFQNFRSRSDRDAWINN